MAKRLRVNSDEWRARDLARSLKAAHTPEPSREHHCDNGCGTLIDEQFAYCDGCQAVIDAETVAALTTTPEPQPNWTTQDFISWGQYLIAAIENGWDVDERAAIAEFVDRFGRRVEDDEQAYADAQG